MNHAKELALFSWEKTFGTPGAVALLEQFKISPAELLSRHQRGDWGDVDKDDGLSNEQARVSGARIISVYYLRELHDEAERIWIITDAADDNGVRQATTVMKPEEY